MEDVIAPIVDELSRALGMDREVLQRELTLLIVEYKVPPEEARRSLLKKHRRITSVSPVAMPLDISAPSSWQPVPAQVAESPKPLEDVRVGDAGITIIANVVNPTVRSISTMHGTMRVISGMLEDETAKLHFTSWVDSPDIFKAGAITARDVHVKSFHGMPSININEKTLLEGYNGQIQHYQRHRRTLADLSRTDGVYDAEAEVDLLSIRPGSGLIERCPACSRVMQKGQCRAHGKIEGVPDLRIKAVIDDGTGSMICVFDRALTEQIIGVSLDAIHREPDNTAVLIRAAVIGTPLIVRGNVTSGDFGMIFVAAEIERPSESASKLAKKLLGEVR